MCYTNANAIAVTCDLFHYIYGVAYILVLCVYASFSLAFKKQQQTNKQKTVEIGFDFNRKIKYAQISCCAYFSHCFNHMHIAQIFNAWIIVMDLLKVNVVVVSFCLDLFASVQ